MNQMIDLPKKLLLFTALLAVAALLPAAAASAAQPVQTRVIVTLVVPEATAGADPSTAISEATEALLATLPGGDYTVTNRYTVMPFVALTAGASTLSVLQQSSLVAAIERDGTVSAAPAPAKCKTVKASKKHRKAKTAKQCVAGQVAH